MKDQRKLQRTGRCRKPYPEANSCLMRTEPGADQKPLF